MVRNIILLIVFSFIIVIFKPHIAGIFGTLGMLYHYVFTWLNIKMGSFQMGVVPRSTIALVLVPLAFALLGSVILLLMHKKSRVIAPAMLWSIWLILATTLIFKTV
ncbi:MAG: hypothetical protein M3R00_08935 [Pseudomonadota bacterium]|nr:hypothetical protein [Pseudomonadota bacterium]